MGGMNQEVVETNDITWTTDDIHYPRFLVSSERQTMVKVPTRLIRSQRMMTTWQDPQATIRWSHRIDSNPQRPLGTLAAPIGPILMPERFRAFHGTLDLGTDGKNTGWGTAGPICEHCNRTIYQQARQLSWQ